MTAQFSPNTEGVFVGLSEAEYRSAPGVSQSMLKQFNEEPTPKHFQESLSRPRIATESMEFGTVLHAAILTPELLSQTHHLRPEAYRVTVMKCPTCASVTDSKTCSKCKCERVATKIEKPWDGRATVCQEWMTAHADRIIIDAEQEKAIPKIVDTVMSLPVASDIIRTGQKEVSFFKRDPETGLMLKCRVDAISTDTDGLTHIADLKKVRRAYAKSERFGVSCVEYGYDIQEASYLFITGASRFLFVAMEEEAPFEAETFEMDRDDVMEGYVKWRKILLRYAEAVADGTWPGYTRTVKRLKLPAWAKDRERPEAENIYD